MNYDEKNLDDPDYDIERYDSVAGWEPHDPFKKQRENARKERRQTLIYGSMLETMPANDWRLSRHERATPPQQLFEDLWFEGDTALLFGGKGSGKSVLAVQIGESIARRERVLYIDCQLNRRQWEERYSSQPFPGDPRRLHHRFPRNFRRAAFEWDGTVPEAFNGDLSKFLRHSIMEAIDKSQAKVVILDDLNAFCSGSTTSVAATKALRLLKLLSVTDGLSILVLHGIPDQRFRTPHSALRTQTLRICEAADTAFTICRSTFAEDIRYVKHLASSRPITRNETNVLTYRLERRENAFATVNGECKTVNDPNTSSLTTNHSPLTTSPPFLGLTALGPSIEQDHLRDHAAEALAAYRAHQAHLKKLRHRSGRDILVDGVLDGSYGKYLKGE